MVERIVDGRYELLEVVATGGMATVWRALDTRLGREVALKRPHPTADPVGARFEREARLAAGLSHPNVVTVHDSGVDENGPYLVMELLDAPSLAERRVDPEEAVAVGIAVADALSAIHAAGIVHRDIKPANVILAPGGPKLTDFGIAHDPTATGPLTLPHQVLATPSYAAPEVLAGRTATPAADIFSLGALVYELVSGRVAFPARPGEARRRPPALGIPDLDAVLARCLADDPSDRPTAAEVAAALRRGGLPTIAMPVAPVPTAPEPSGGTLTDVPPSNPPADPTVEYRGSATPTDPTRDAPRPARRGLVAVGAVLAVVGLAAVAAAVIAEPGTGDPVEPVASVPAVTETTAAAPDTTAAPETTSTIPETTTTTIPETTTTVPETTTTAPETTTTNDSERSVDEAREGFLADLEDLRRDDRLGRREAREIAGDVDQAVDAHRSGDDDEVRSELEEIADQIEQVDDDEAAGRLVEGFVRLAEALGFRVEVGG